MKIDQEEGRIGRKDRCDLLEVRAELWFIMMRIKRVAIYGFEREIHDYFTGSLMHSTTTDVVTVAVGRRN